jgi:hypothetical protein
MMTATAAPPATLTPQQLATLFQYTVEAYKTFQKLAETLPNPRAATVFKQFAADERGIRNLIEMKIAAGPADRPRVTLGADLAFTEVVQGELSNREAAEFLIARERTMQKKLREMVNAAGSQDRNLLISIEALKRSHIVELERELELIREDDAWWSREDAEWRIVHGAPTA